MLDAGRCEGYAGGAGGVGMQADAERTVQIDRASCASEGERTDAGRGGTGERAKFHKNAGTGWSGAGINVRSEYPYTIPLHSIVCVVRL